MPNRCVRTTVGETLGTVVDGTALAARVAMVVVVVPAEFVKTASYLFPLSASERLVSCKVSEVAPLMGMNESLPAGSTIHCTAGAGLPVAAAVKVTACPTIDDWLTGFVVTSGGAGARFTANVAAAEAAEEPMPLEKTASYWLPLSPSVTGPRSSVTEVAPAIAEKVLLPAGSTIHWTVGAGLPLAAAVKVASCPTVSV